MSIRSVVVAAMVVMGGAFAADYTWMSSPADANWNTTSLNWNTGEAWVDLGLWDNMPYE